MTIIRKGTNRVIQPGHDTVHYHEVGWVPCRLLIRGSGGNDPVQGEPAMGAV